MATDPNSSIESTPTHYQVCDQVARAVLAERSACAVSQVLKISLCCVPSTQVIVYVEFVCASGQSTLESEVKLLSLNWYLHKFQLHPNPQCSQGMS